jgi:predicted ATP-dependent Lon-type protease
MMNDEILLSQLEELADKLEILVRDENINNEESSSTGGLCRMEGKYVLILNSKITVKEKNQVMIKALRQFDLRDIYIKPVIRELLEGYERNKRVSPRNGNKAQ